jgi:hypothetical protein
LVKIAALAPNIVVEVSPTADQAEGERVGRELRAVQLGAAQPLSGASTDAALEEETRAGIHRLSELVRGLKKKKTQIEGESPYAIRELRLDDPLAQEQKRKAALRFYRKVAGFQDPTEESGIILNKVS